MSDINLSKAVRSNLLSLQNTASMMAKTQERLATGLKVNSAMDNPTNFFTASGLKSRAGDLGLLMDSVSNAVQTLAAADKGIAAITKLVESAQATARQALQTAATISQPGAATAGTVTAGAFSTVDVSGAGEEGEAATVVGGAFTDIDLSAEATAAQITGGNFSNIDFTNSGGNDGQISFNLTIDGETKAISVGHGDFSSGQNAVTAEAMAEALNAKINAAFETTGETYVTVAEDNGDKQLVFTSPTTGANSNIAIADFAATNGATGSGIADGTDAGAAGDSISFDLAINGGDAQTITIDAAAVAAYNDANDAELDVEALTAEDIVALINDQAGAEVASVNDQGGIDFSATSNTANPTVAITNFAESVTDGASGLANGNDTGEAGVAADAISFSIAVDGGNATTVTISAATVTAYNNANSNANLDASALTAENVAALINHQLGNNSSVASVSEDGNLVFTSGTTGANSSVAITNLSSNTTEGSAGIANGNNTGTAAGEAVDVVNPKRAELVSQYNELLQQINDLAKDASFNGVNLLNGDELQVIFNEDGSSRLDVAGVNFDYQGLGLAELDANAFDTNAGINSVLTDLKSGIETLRSQASKFGSNLQVVETRQNFTKDMINVLETGAANLTLADTNEEAANLLALQTRQQLASTALSMASQADQAVLRLF